MAGAGVVASAMHPLEHVIISDVHTNSARFAEITFIAASAL